MSTEQRDDGGPAVQLPVDLRDYFAASALQAMKLANSWCDNPLYWEGVARSAYVCADAMLIARSANEADAHAAYVAAKSELHMKARTQ